MIDEVQEQIGTFRIEMPKGLKDELDKMANQTGLATRKEVVLSAISHLQWSLGKISTGYKILANKDDRFLELDTPYFIKARREAIEHDQPRLERKPKAS